MSYYTHGKDRDPLDATEVRENFQTGFVTLGLLTFLFMARDSLGEEITPRASLTGDYAAMIG